MKSAVVDAFGNVINTIMADPETDAAPEDCILIAIRNNSPVSAGWKYDGVANQFSMLLTDEPLNDG